jgi:hypothetical protein
MGNSFSSRQSSRLFLIIAGFALVLALGGASKTYAQGCPTLFSPNRGWAQNTIARYAFTGNFTEEQKRQIRAAAAEWSRANSSNNSKVSVVEAAAILRSSTPRITARLSRLHPPP